MSEFTKFQRKGLSEMRPFVEGEPLDNISVSEEDRKLPTLAGGFIARNPVNHADQWYVSKTYHDANLEAVTAATNGNMSFGQALDAMAAGNKVARSGWNGKNMFIYKTVGNTVSRDFIPKFASLPPAVKTFLEQRGTDVIFQSSFTMYTAAGEMQPGWLASQSDMQATDWGIVN